MASFIVMAIVLVLHFPHSAVPSKLRPFQDPDFGLNTIEMIKNHGYVYESHTITTEDGYILTYHRIPHGKFNEPSPEKPVVLLMHGALASSADFVNMGPNRSLGYILADDGYDVWLANCRGNAWSRKHTKLDAIRDAKEFFDFSWHEIGYYDLPAAIDYILDFTKNDKLFYVGHSQGGSDFLVMASTRPGYNRRIRLASLMAPAAFMEHQSNAVTLFLGKIVYEIEKITQRHHIFEIPLVEEFRRIAINYCTKHMYILICEALLFAFIGNDEPQFDQNKIAVLLSTTPSNAGLKLYLHYGQLLRNGGFSQYDYGVGKNLRKYGTTRPPAYNLSQISAPLAIYYGKNDVTVNFTDVQKLISKLPNVVNDYMVPDFNHFDFMYAIDVVKLVFEELMKVMKRF